MVLLLAGCATAGPTTAASITPADTKGDYAPTPYNAEQIRDATRPGRTYDFLIEAAEKPAVHHVITFLSVGDKKADVRSATTDDHGTDLIPAKTSSPAWEELRNHAQFPRSAVTIDAEQITVPAGTYDCLKYTVKGDDGEVSVYDFAKDMPGAPVLFYTEKNGVRMMTGTLVRYLPGN